MSPPSHKDPGPENKTPAQSHLLQPSPSLLSPFTDNRPAIITVSHRHPQNSQKSKQIHSSWQFSYKKMVLYKRSRWLRESRPNFLVHTLEGAVSLVSNIIEKYFQSCQECCCLSQHVSAFATAPHCKQHFDIMGYLKQNEGKTLHIFKTTCLRFVPNDRIWLLFAQKSRMDQLTCKWSSSFILCTAQQIPVRTQLLQGVGIKMLLCEAAASWCLRTKCLAFVHADMISCSLYFCCVLCNNNVSQKV